MMDAAVQSGGDRAVFFQDGLDDLSFDALDGWLKEPSLYEDLQPVPAVWSSFDIGGGPNVNADQKKRLEPIARALEPATPSHLKFKTTSAAIAATSPNTANVYQIIANHVCDDNFASFGLQTCADVASPELRFQYISHSCATTSQQTSHTMQARHENLDQSPTQCTEPPMPSFELHQISDIHMYPMPSSPSIAMPTTSSPLGGAHKQTQPTTFNGSIQPPRSNVFPSAQFAYISADNQAPKRVSTTLNNSQASFPTKMAPSLASVSEDAIFSARAVSSTPSEGRSQPFSVATPSTVASPGTRPPAKAKRKRDEFNLDNTCSEVAFKDKSGAVAAYTQVFGTAKNLRQAYSEGQRKEIARTRKLGACDRCKRFKMKCHRPDSPYELCLRCVMSSPQVLNMPCFLAKPVEAELFRDKPSIMHPLETPRSEVYRLIDIEAPKYHYLKLQLTQDLGVTLEVEVVQYKPKPNEKTAHPWKDRSGLSRALEMPPYCIAAMTDARQKMLNYINTFRGAFLSKLRMSCNEITGKIIDEARRYEAFNPDSTVRKAMDLFAATRIIEHDWRICGNNTLGINVVEDEENPWFNKIPVTPIMDTQLDQIVIQGFLKPLRDQLLQELQTKIYESRRENWFEIFLTTSILLTNAELLLSHSRKNAKRYGANSRYNSLDRAYKYFHTCNLLIAHFHFVCVGFAPLKLDWTSANVSSMAVLDLDQIKFMMQLQDMIKRKEEHVLGLRKKREYEEELYWCHQLFFEKWEWEKPRIEDE